MNSVSIGVLQGNRADAVRTRTRAQICYKELAQATTETGGPQTHRNAVPIVMWRLEVTCQPQAGEFSLPQKGVFSGLRDHPTHELPGKLGREGKCTPNSQGARDQKHHFWKKRHGPEHLCSKRQLLLSSFPKLHRM